MLLLHTHGQKGTLEAEAIIALTEEEEAMEPITALRVVVRQSDVGFERVFIRICVTVDAV